MGYEINLIEGERGKLHVTSDDARTKNALMFGTGRKVFNMDHAFEATMPDSNTVRITSGVFYDNGMFIRIDRDRYVEVPVDNGLPGTYRNDLICIRYERNIQTQLESASIVVKKGEASETKAVDPAYSVGDVLDLEVHLDEFPLYRVALDGITPKLEPMFAVEDVMSNISLYEEIINHIQDFDNPHQITNVNHAVTADKLAKAVKINGVAFDGTEDVVFPKVESDAALSTTSTNAVQNKVVTAALDECAKIGYSGYGDVNNLVNEGMYQAYRCSNMPDGVEYCGLIVVKDGITLNDTRVRQIALINSTYAMYTRYTNDSTDSSAWSEWKKMLTAEDISKSTAITTAGTYALDAVQNNASVSGTLANKIKNLSANCPQFISDYKKTLIANVSAKSYTAAEDCLVRCDLVTSGTAFEIMNIKINDIMVYVYQNPTSQASVQSTTSYILKKGDVIKISAVSSAMHVYVKN